MGRTGAQDVTPDLPWGQPTSPRERRRAAVHLGTAGLVTTLVVLAVVFDQFAATGVLLVAFLSFVLTYLIAPAAEWLRRAAAPSRRGRPLSRPVATLAIYGGLTSIIAPLWAFYGERLRAAGGRMWVLVPDHTARFVERLHATEGWHEALGLPMTLDAPLGAMTQALTRSIETETQALGAELLHAERLLPWLSVVPVVAFLLLTRWHAFRRSTSRVLPTPHLQWRGDEFLQNLNTLLAAYTRAQALSALIVAGLCWTGFAALRLPYPGTLGLTAGLLEMVPLAGPLVAAVVATAVAPERTLAILAFLAALRLLQDYVIYPRLIRRALHLPALGVVVALWLGAALGGLVGVCLAVPLVGVLRVTHRHWREYREIEALVAEASAQRAAVTPPPVAPAAAAGADRGE